MPDPHLETWWASVHPSSFCLDWVWFTFQCVVGASHAWFLRPKKWDQERKCSVILFNSAATPQKVLVKFPMSVKSKCRRKLQKAKGPVGLFLSQMVGSAAVWYVCETKDRISWVSGFFGLYRTRGLSGPASWPSSCFGVMKKGKGKSYRRRHVISNRCWSRVGG